MYSSGGQPLSPSGNPANFISFESGNWASAMSTCLGMAGGGLVPSDWWPTAAGDAAAAATAGNDHPLPAGGMGAAGMAGGMGMGNATLVGKLSVPPSWAGSFAPTASPVTAMQTVGLTGAAPQAAPGAFVPGVPGLAGAGRSAAGFGAPRYGVKPIVMPKLSAV